MERTTRQIKNLDLQFPVLDDWELFYQSAGTLLQSIAMDFGDLPIPDDVQILEDEPSYRVWALLTAKVFQIKALRKQLIDIVLDYLAPHVEGVESRDMRMWIGKNLPVSLIPELFAAVLRVDDWLKKNAVSLLEEVFQVYLKPSSPRNSLPKPAGTSTRSEKLASFATDFS